MISSLGLSIMISLGTIAMLLVGTSAPNVDSWLEKNSVRFVAVEFYASWCKPCREAVPRWQALHTRYRRHGFRFVVVVTQDPKGDCENPGWRPDEIVCDDQGVAAEKFGAKSLPAAFLWNWRGELLLNRGPIEDVEREIIDWVRAAPRVEVAAGDIVDSAEIDAASLIELVRGSLRERDKLDVVVTKAERTKLDRLKTESFAERYDESLHCKLGQDLPANSLLLASLTGRSKRTILNLSLFSAEKGCLLANAAADWQASDSRKILAGAVGELMSKLRRPAEMPSLVKARAVETATQEPPPTKLEPPNGMILIPGGNVVIGCKEQSDSECDADEKPHRFISLGDFWIDETEVTVAQYRACVDAGKCSAAGLNSPYWSGNIQSGWAQFCNWQKSGREQHPINCVDWSQADTFCRFAQKRLPREHEWEKAARGSDSRKFPWGDRFVRDGKLANLADGSLRKVNANVLIIEGYEDGFGGTAPVGVFTAGRSPFGVFDMSGNVSEWTVDLRGSSRILRGGSWYDLAKAARASERDWEPTDGRFASVGFRCAR